MIEGKISSYSLESEISGDSSLEGKVSSGHYIEGEVASEHFVEGEVASEHSVEGEIASERSITGKVSGSQRMAAAIAPKALDGISPEIEITEVEGGHKLVVTDKNGKKEAVVLDGEDGRGIELFWQSKVTTIPGDTNEWTIRYTDGTESVIAIKNSEDGKPGAPGYTPIKGVDYDDGAPGFSPVVSLRKEGEVTLLAITDIKGTQEVRINDGEPGTPGGAGVGIANVTQVVKSGTDGGTNVVTIALTDGTEHSFEVQNGTKGRAITVIDVDETLADDEHNRVVFSDGSVLKIKNGRTGSPGKDGESITIEDVSESYLDGGKNTVTFSDGTVLTVRNGRRGSEEQPDWGENDQLAGNFVKNKTHWVEQTLKQLVSDWGVGAGTSSGTSSSGETPEPLLKVGERYVINPDGFCYCTAYAYTDNNGAEYIALGDSRLDTEGGAASRSHPEETPCFIKFVFESNPNGNGGVDWYQRFWFYYPDDKPHYTTVYSLSGDVVYHPLDERFIPDTIARVSQLGEVGTTITGFVENTEPGGSSIVNFSDGSSLAIKNGINGRPGDPGYTPQKNIDYFDGEDGYTPVKGKDYFDGEDGRGIAMFWQSAHDPNPGGTNSWTIQYTDGTESVISVKNGENGSNGSSVYISSIKESAEDGGENVVTFGGTAVPMSLTIKNGSKGSAGKSAYQIAVDGGYTGTEAEFAELLLGNHEHNASAITSGTLPLARGGTGRALTRTSNALIRFSSSSDYFSTTATKSGALYATSSNGAPSFGTLPIAQGGTGATTAEGVLTNLGVTATASELNSLSGVSDNVQAQLSAKANTATLEAHTGNGTVHISAAERTAWNNKAGDFSIEIYNGTSGNPKPVRFASFNYSTCNSENGLAAKISLVSGHGNGSSYAFLEDAIIKVTHTGAVSVDNFKYYGASAGTYDGAARQYGDIFWLVDTTNKIVDFYCLMGQYARVYQTPWKRLTYSTGGSVTQHTSCTVYSSGTMNWGNNTEIATLSDIPTSLPPAEHTHIHLQNGTVGIKASDSNEISFASNANYLYFGYDNRMGSSGIVDTYKFGTHSGAANAAKGTIECGKVVENGTALTDKYAPKSHSHDYLPTSGGTLSGSLDFSNSSSWITPYLLAFKNADTGASPTYPYTGFYQWGNEWQVNARDANNAWAKNVMSINLVSGVATFGATPTVNGVSMHHDGNNARSTLVSAETNPTTNGFINWKYE